MSRYELTISPDYASNWTYIDAARELFQNGLDQETVSKDNKMFHEYDKETNELKIGNKSSVLNIETLLLGKTSKANDDNTIGQFGEGYKIAALVLTREGKPLTIYNYQNREVWVAKFVKSRRYNNQLILVFDINKKHIWEKTPDNDLTITIGNISEEEYEKIVESNLHCQDDIGEVIEAKDGRILLDKHKGKIFVNGLYVCSREDFEYSYDFKPSAIKLDRDRGLIESYNLEWRTSQMWLESGSDRVLELAKNNKKEVHYISDVWIKPKESVSSVAFKDFREQYGQKAVPVVDQNEVEDIRMRYSDANPVIVSSSYKKIIVEADDYVVDAESVDLEDIAPVVRLENYIKSLKDLIYYSKYKEGLEILKLFKPFEENNKNEDIDEDENENEDDIMDFLEKQEKIDDELTSFLRDEEKIF